MPKFKLIALSNAIDGTELEFRQWYEKQHLSDVCAVPGVIGASFLKSAGGDGRWQYLAIYDVDVDEPATVLAEIRRRSGTDLMPMSPALARDDVFFGVFGDPPTSGEAAVSELV